MQKQNIAQLEMFNDDESSLADKGGYGGDPLRVKIVRGYQKLILKGIALIFISLVAYSRGVEKGKQQAVSLAGTLNQKAVVSDAAVHAVSSGITPAAAREPIGVINTSPVMPAQSITVTNPETGKPNYTIQVASISKNANVKSELARLRNKGYTAFSLVKGKYTVICVGRFEAKVDARDKLEKLKSRYPDCQIRRL